MNKVYTSDQLETRLKIAHHVEDILRLLGQDVTSEGLKGTPDRVAKYYMEFLNWEPGNTDTTFESIDTDQMVLLKDIPFWSACEHHLLPFFGHISIGYLTGKKVIGLSKLARIAQKHAHKFQLQERLAHQIADELQEIIDDSSGVAVFIKAKHSCMHARGIRSDGQMITSVLRGLFREDHNVKNEFLLLVKD